MKDARDEHRKMVRWFRFAVACLILLVIIITILLYQLISKELSWDLLQRVFWALQPVYAWLV